jgi:hypothetical protein
MSSQDAGGRMPAPLSVTEELALKDNGPAPKTK